jgi:hypothetical protein
MNDKPKDRTKKRMNIFAIIYPDFAVDMDCHVLFNDYSFRDSAIEEYGGEMRWTKNDLSEMLFY